MNWKQNDWAQLLPIAELAYNNSKNASIGHTLFELNCGYYPRVSFKDKCDTCFKSSSAKGVAVKLKELMNVSHQNFLYVQDLQKRASDERVNLRSYTPGEKVWLNSKYIKTKRKQKLETKFFGPFQVLHPVRK